MSSLRRNTLSRLFYEPPDSCDSICTPIHRIPSTGDMEMFVVASKDTIPSKCRGKYICDTVWQSLKVVDGQGVV